MLTAAQAKSCFRAPLQWVVPTLSAILFTLVAWQEAGSFARAMYGALAVMGCAAAIRLAVCRICRDRDEYVIVNLLRTRRFPVPDVVSATTPRLFGALGVPWVRLALVNGDRLWITALPGDARNKHVAAFLNDFHIRLEQRARTGSAQAESKPSEGAGDRRGWNIRVSTRRGLFFLFWGIVLSTLTAVLIFAPVSRTLVGAVWWIGIVTMIATDPARRRTRRDR